MVKFNDDIIRNKWEKGGLDGEVYITLRNPSTQKALTAVSAPDLEIKGKNEMTTNLKIYKMLPVLNSIPAPIKGTPTIQKLLFCTQMVT